MLSSSAVLYGWSILLLLSVVFDFNEAEGFEVSTYIVDTITRTAVNVVVEIIISVSSHKNDDALSRKVVRSSVLNDPLNLNVHQCTVVMELRFIDTRFFTGKI